MTVAEIIKASLSTLEMGQNDGMFVDFKARCDGQYDCVTVQNVKEIMDKVSMGNSLVYS